MGSSRMNELADASPQPKKRSNGHANAAGVMEVGGGSPFQKLSKAPGSVLLHGFCSGGKIAFHFFAC